jgi:hypothetical protein
MKSKLERDDAAYCASHGMTYFPPDPPISLEDFENEPHYRNQGPAQGEPQMWTPGSGRYGRDSERESDTTTSRSEWGMMLVVGMLLLIIAVGLAQ